MKALIQRVAEASVEVEGRVVSRIGQGLLTLLAIEATDAGDSPDSDTRLRRLIERILNLRVFEDSQGKMNRSLLDVGGEHLIISQFTLAADCSSGRRPSFTGAAAPNVAKERYENALRISAESGVRTASGVFQAHMRVSLVNDGPATFWIEA